MGRIHFEQFTTEDIKDQEKFRIKLNELVRRITDALNYTSFGTPITSGVQSGQLDGVYVSWITSATGTISHQLKRSPVGCMVVSGGAGATVLTASTSTTVGLSSTTTQQSQYLLLF